MATPLSTFTAVNFVLLDRFKPLKIFRIIKVQYVDVCYFNNDLCVETITVANLCVKIHAIRARTNKKEVKDNKSIQGYYSEANSHSF